VITQFDCFEFSSFVRDELSCILSYSSRFKFNHQNTLQEDQIRLK